LSKEESTACEHAKKPVSMRGEQAKKIKQVYQPRAKPVLAITNTPTNTAIVPFEGELEHGSPSVVAQVSGDNQSSDLIRLKRIYNF
jgi:hypothetical protein